MKKNTTGPWRVCGTITTPDGSTLHVVSGRLTKDTDTDVGSAHRVEDARLMAIAPDLLSIANLSRELCSIDVNDMIGRVKITALQGAISGLIKATYKKLDGGEDMESA